MFSSWRRPLQAVSGIKFKNRKLSWLSDRHHRTGARGTRAGAGAEIWCPMWRSRTVRCVFVATVGLSRLISRMATRCVVAAVIIATGAEYRHLALTDLARFVGVGVYYAATYVESQLCMDEEIIVVGGGNFGRAGRRVPRRQLSPCQYLVRAEGLCREHVALSYPPHRGLRPTSLCTCARSSPRLRQRPTRARDLAQRSRWQGHDQGYSPCISMTGAVPNTRWLQGGVPLDDRGFVRVGSDLRAEDLLAARLAVAARPVPHGDWRAGHLCRGRRCAPEAVKRVASAVGEGSISVQLVHRVCRSEPLVSGADEIVFLFDVDNTLLDNDCIEADIGATSRRTVSDARDAIASGRSFEELRGEFGFANYLGTVQRFRPRGTDRSARPRTLLIPARLSIRKSSVIRARSRCSRMCASSVARSFCRTVDAVFQPHKIRRAGLWDAVEGRVLIYVHKERMLEDVQHHYPAERYVMVDDKPGILAAHEGPGARA